MSMREKQTKMRRPGIEPRSTAWKATMLTVTPPTPAERTDQMFKRIMFNSMTIVLYLAA